MVMNEGIWLGGHLADDWLRGHLPCDGQWLEWHVAIDLVRR